MKTVYSALQPTGALTIGNYLGAIKNMQSLASEHTCYFAVADLHSLTISGVPAELRQNTYSLVAVLLACGLDADNCTLYLQSHVSAHAELAWVLGCFTQFGEAGRMIQFKEKSARDRANVNVGLFVYPVLMAADILLYQADLVPVGIDQKQHLELARDLAIRFNNRFSPTFVVPERVTGKQSGKIFSLCDPTAKMSKSDANPNASILILDSADVIRRKLSRAVTDSGSEIVFRKDKPGISNLLTIYSEFVGVSIKTAQSQVEGKSYAEFKSLVADVVIEGLRPLQAEYARLIADKSYLDSVLKAGAESASRAARKTLSKVYRKVGLVAREG